MRKEQEELHIKASFWLLFGDFNTARFSNKKVGGHPLSFAQLSFFNDFVTKCSFLDLKSVGSTWTWNNKSKNFGRIAGRLDRVLCSTHWIDIPSFAYYKYLLHSTSDHSPMVYI